MIRVQGTTIEVTIANTAMAQLRYPLTRLTKPILIVFTSQLPRRADGGLATGYSHFSQRKILVNKYAPTKDQPAIILHEIGHFVDVDTLSGAQRNQAMALMVPPGDSWGGTPYWSLPVEAFCNGFVEAWSPLKSLYKGDYRRSIPTANLAALRGITLNTGPIDMPSMPGENVASGLLAAPVIVVFAVVGVAILVVGGTIVLIVKL